MHRDAVISPCGQYRYLLRRVWDPALPVCTFIMLNPSKADGTIDDPTIRRCIGFARAWGYGGFVVVNLFAYRGTKPAELRRAWDPVGPANDRYIFEAALLSGGPVVAAWGAGGDYMGRAAAVRSMLPRLHALALTQSGQPRHPLYLRADLVPRVLGADG